jgi:chaperone modulatory protein CbpM
MRHDIVTVTTAYIVDDLDGLSLTQLCHSCGLSVDTVVEMVDEGILQVQGSTRKLWRFSSKNLRRARIAVRLKQDLEINLAGIAVTLQLLDNVEELRGRLRIVEAQNLPPES